MAERGIKMRNTIENKTRLEEQHDELETKYVYEPSVICVVDMCDVDVITGSNDGEWDPNH